MGTTRFARACLWLSRRLGGRSVFGYRYVSPVETMLGAYMGLVSLAVILKHSEQIGHIVGGTSDALRFMLGDLKGDDDRAL